MNGREFLRKLQSQDASFEIHDDRLKYRGPDEIFTPQVLATLRHHKHEILGLLHFRDATLADWDCAVATVSAKWHAFKRRHGWAPSFGDDRDFEVELDVRRGRGYVTADDNAIEVEGIIGKIPVDSIYSPVMRVRYSIEQTRVGKLTNYDRLMLEIWTDGTISPEMALVESAKIYRKHLNPFVLQDEFKDNVLLTDDPVDSEFNQNNREISEIERALDRSLLELELSVRAKNCLDGANLQTIRDLVSLSEQEVMNLKNLGKTSLTEIKSKLAERGLALGMAAE